MDPRWSSVKWTLSLGAAAGSVLLTIAAIVRSWDRLVSPLAGAELKFRVAYDLGLISLIWGVLRFLS